MRETVPVRRVSASAYEVPTDTPEADGTRSWTSTTLVVVEAEADGAVGLGYTYGPAATAALVADELEPVAVGRSAEEPASTWQAMVRRLRDSPRSGTASMALSAVDCALWDLMARLHETPLARLLGQVHPAVPAYGSGGFTTYDRKQLDDQLEAWMLEGFDAVKIKIGENSGDREHRDIHRISQARDLVGPDVEIMVDANGAYSVKQAIRVMHEVSELDVRWCEEPVSSDDLGGLADVRGATSAEVAAGGHGDSLDYFARLCAARSVDCLQVDLSRCGGITEWRRITALAAAHHLDVSCKGAPLLHLPAAAATSNTRHLEWFHDHARIESRLFDSGAARHGAWLMPPTEPGNGLRLKERDALPYRVA